MPRLNAADLATALGRLSGWTAANNEIGKTFVFGNFVEAIAFVNRVAELAEAARHHPDIDIRYNRVRIVLTTRDDGGVSEKDTALAGAIEGMGASGVEGRRVRGEGMRRVESGEKRVRGR